MPRLILITALFFWFPADLMAQSGGFAGAYNRMGFGPRGMSMGNAMTAVHQQGIFAHYNPALSAKVEQTQIDISSSAMSFDRSFNALSASFEMPPSAGVTVGILHAGVSDFDGRSLSGYPTDRFSINEYNFFVAFGLRASESFNIGVSAKLLYADFYDDVPTTTGFGLDIGALYHVTDRLNLGLAIQDMLSGYQWDTGDLYGTSGISRNDNFPTRIKFGAAYDIPEYNLLVSAEAETRLQRSRVVTRVRNTQFGGPVYVTSEDEIQTSSQQFRMGAAYGIHERVTLRGGWQINDVDLVSETHQPSLGFSLHLPFNRYSPSIDYTFIREPGGISYMHVFAIQLKL